MKKLNRKLIPAFAMLLLSAVLMSTASFAWFSQNGKVTASGFQVQATAPAALWISADSDGPFESSYAYEATSVTELNPVTKLGVANGTDDPDGWTFNTLVNAQGVDEKGNVLDADGKKVDMTDAAAMAAYMKDDGQSNVFMTSFYLLLEGNRETEATLEKKTVSATMTVSYLGKDTKVDGIYKSLRVALVTSGGTADDEITNSAAGSCILKPNADLNKAGDKVTFTTVAAQDAICVYMYIWFEGTDGNCYNTNAQNLHEFGIQLDFSAA